MKKIICFLMFLLLLTACQEKDSAIETWQRDELVKINEHPVKSEEAAVYGIQIKKEFEQIGGRDIWEFESFSGGKSAYEVAKTKVLENLIRVKILATKAEERKIKLTEAEEKEAVAKAEEFYADKKTMMAASVDTISPETITQVFLEFELGQKLKREMLRSFQPSPEMIAAKLAEDETYQALEKEDLREKYEHFMVQMTKLEINEGNQKRIEEIQNQLSENQGLTDAFSQSMVYQEEKYTRPELDAIFGQGFADDLRQNDEQLILSQDGTAYIYIKLVGIQLLAPEQLHLELKNQEQKKQKLREQAEESIRDESFDIIYKEWKKEANVEVNQEVWKEFEVFSLQTTK
ncbi:hypothetical protein EII17_00630 [Clostridiales bacterium COT073_COT-073]|nr:hypothetical protein EII17_00630 [Clostridiales bacterium COT073_COT-073]